MNTRDSRRATKCNCDTYYSILNCEMSSRVLVHAIETSAIILARCTEGSIDRDQLVAKLQTCTLFSTTQHTFVVMEVFKAKVMV